MSHPSDTSDAHPHSRKLNSSVQPIVTAASTDSNQPLLSPFSPSSRLTLSSPEFRLQSTYFLSGALARLTSSVIISPLDCLKSRAQFTQFNAVGVRSYSGVWDCAKKMWKYEGPIAFYRGLPARMLYVGPAAAVSFVCYEQFRMAFHAHQSTASIPASSSSTATAANSSYFSSHYLAPLILVGLARMAGSTMRTPFDLVRQRMQIQGSLLDRKQQLNQALGVRRAGVYRNTLEAIREIAKEGPRTMFTGLTISIIRDIPFAVIYFFTYEYSKTLQQRYLMATDSSAVSSSSSSPSSITTSTEKRYGMSTPRYMLSGSLAASCAVLVTMPADVIKTRLQTQGSLQEVKYKKGIIDCAKTIMREEGARGFFKGAVPRLLYLAPASAITFSVYELYKRQLQSWLDVEEI